MEIESRADDRPPELPEVTADHDGPAPRQRGPWNDPSMRDGDSSRGNPYEDEGEELTIDRDTSDAEDEPVRAGIDGGAAEGTTTEMRPDVDSNADDFTLRPGEGGADAGPLDDDDRLAADLPPAVTDVYPHPVVDPGEDGSTIGKNLSAPTAARLLSSPRARAEPEPAREAGERGPAEAEPAHDKEPRDQSPGHDLPIAGYQDLTVIEIVEKAGSLSADDLKQIHTFEARHRKRKTLLAKLDRLLDAAGGKKSRRRKTGDAK